MTKSFFDIIGDDKLVELMNAGVRKAIQETHAAGLPVTGKIDGVLCRLYPDGRIERLDQNADGK